MSDLKPLYRAYMRGEDGLEFAIDVAASSQQELDDEIEQQYPDATVIRTISFDDLFAENQARIQRLQDEYDDGY